MDLLDIAWTVTELVVDLRPLIGFLLPVELSENLYAQISVRNKPLSTVRQGMLWSRFSKCLWSD